MIINISILISTVQGSICSYIDIVPYFTFLCSVVATCIVYLLRGVCLPADGRSLVTFFLLCDIFSNVPCKLMDVTETNRPVLLENDLDAKIENSNNETIYD